ncbi:MAG: Ig-like domain-containing protein, partial [marine benthic group bacterium]|nr:Ig-like domain-containing protein [Gemmatimonadota bacterium]
MKSRQAGFRGSWAGLLAAALTYIVLSCSGDSNDPAGPGDPTPPIDPPPGDPSVVVVTEPVLLQIGAQSVHPVDGGFGSLFSSADEEVSYVSFPPGSQPETDTVEVVNRTRDLATGAPMMDGGLDPLPIPASVGDTLVITTYRQTMVFELVEREVPDRKPPIIVRTDPPRGKTRVPLNSVIVIVFSEPVDGATVTPTTVRLLRDGQLVQAALELAADGLSLDVQPDGGLQSSSRYEVVVETDLADRIGDNLESQFTTDFQTVPAQLQGEIVFESRRSGNNEVWTMKADGTGFFQITDRIDGGVATAPALSPDGRKIAFSLAEP